jgi:hypothetical protein
MLNSTNPVLPDGMDCGLNHLDFLLSAEPMLPDDRQTCVLVLAELKILYQSVLPTQRSCSVASILCFPKEGPGQFASLVKRRVPQALIILAYYCVMLDILYDKWWMNGWAPRVLQDVLGSLEERLQHWIQWPLDAVMMKVSKSAVGLLC